MTSARCHTPSVASEEVSRGWNPWATLRERTHIRLRFAELPKACGRGALLDEVDSTRTLLLDFRMGRRDRRCVLGHELVHDIYGLLYPPTTPRGLVAKGEEFVNRETARWLVPLDELRCMIERLVDIGEPVHAAAVCEEFDVSLDVAHKAMFLIQQEMRR